MRTRLRAARLRTAVTLACSSAVACLSDHASAQQVLHVASSGEADAAGSRQAPLTFAAAIRRVAAAVAADGLPDGGVVVRLRGGRYEFTEPFVLDERFAGTAERPIVIEAAEGEDVVFDGAVRIDPDGFGPVTDGAERARLAASAVDRIVVQTVVDPVLIARLESELVLGLTIDRAACFASWFPNGGYAQSVAAVFAPRRPSRDRHARRFLDRARDLVHAGDLSPTVRQTPQALPHAGRFVS